MVDFENKKILIVGKGIEGTAAEKYLRTHLKGGKLDLMTNSC